MVIAFSIFFIALVAVAAVSDLMTMKIPNGISVALIVLFFPAAYLAGFGAYDVGLTVLAALAVFAGCFALFAANVMGGGDAKLLTASALWFGWSASLISFLVIVSFAGGVLTLIVLLLRSKADLVLALGVRLPPSLTTAKKIPYAIAIAAGGLITWPDSPLFQFLSGL